MREAVQIVLGLLADILAGAPTTVVRVGPVDVPIAEWALASAMVAAGARFVVEYGWVTVRFAASADVAGAAARPLIYPPGDDSFVSIDQQVPQLWLPLAPVSVTASTGRAFARRGDKGKDPS